ARKRSQTPTPPDPSPCGWHSRPPSARTFPALGRGGGWTMADVLVRRESPIEYFREQVERAMEHQKVSTSDFVEYYLVNLLANCVGAEPSPTEPRYDDTPLALLYVRAVQSCRQERARLLRTLGDTALFVSGFFADSLSRRLVDLDYYRSMGGFAYARLAQDEDPRVFGPEVYS